MTRVWSSRTESALGLLRYGKAEEGILSYFLTFGRRDWRHLAHDPDSALEWAGRTNIAAQLMRFWGGLDHILAVNLAEER